MSIAQVVQKRSHDGVAELVIITDPVREKHFNVKPMSVEEAIMQMNLLGHSFFVFHNEETKTINVLYQRKDGNYGILIPE